MIRNSVRHLHRLGFTLVELLVVISLFVLLLAIAVPAFSSMLYTSEQSLAEQSLRVAFNTARNVAAGSPAGQDAAAVFMYDSVSRKTTVLVCTQAGVLTDVSTIPVPGTEVNREVFAAAPGVEPIQMTSGWTVRGFAPANSIDDDWYGDANSGPGGGPGTYQSPPALRQQGNWIFPETSFYDDTVANDGASRQTFMVRFEGGTGLVKTSDPRSVLVLSPSESILFRTNPTWPVRPSPPSPSPVPAWDDLSNHPLNPTHESDPVRFCRRVLAWPTVTTLAGGQAGPITLATKRAILGDQATDTILTKPVGQVALCNESRLARGIGAKLDRDTGCVYQNIVDPMFVTATPGTPFATGVDAINQWVEGRLYDANGDPIDSDCRIFSLQRYLGWLQEVTGTRNGEGVGS